MAQDLLNEANDLYQANKYAEAATSFEYLVRTQDDYKDNPLVLHNLARCKYELGQYSEAIEPFERAGAALA